MRNELLGCRGRDSDSLASRTAVHADIVSASAWGYTCLVLTYALVLATLILPNVARPGADL
jgi:hypothetical protein